LGREFNMSVWKEPAAVASFLGGANGLIGELSFRYLLGPQDAVACRIAMGRPEPLDHLLAAPLAAPFTFNNPCMNKLGFMADHLDPHLLTIIGVIFGVLVGWYISKRSS